LKPFEKEQSDKDAQRVTEVFGHFFSFRQIDCIFYRFILPFFVVALNDAVGRWPEITAGRYRNGRFLFFHATLFA
jgi:hypothetical protein